MVWVSRIVARSISSRSKRRRAHDLSLESGPVRSSLRLIERGDEREKQPTGTVILMLLGAVNVGEDRILAPMVAVVPGLWSPWAFEKEAAPLFRHRGRRASQRRDVVQCSEPFARFAFKQGYDGYVPRP